MKTTHAEFEAIFPAIERKYHFRLPDDYRTVVGWLADVDYWTYPHLQPIGPMWIYEGEFFHPQEILNHRPEDHHQPGYLPFAFNGAGDHWCWWPEQDTSAVVFSPHDSYDGAWDAPSFAAWLYQQMLCNAAYAIEAEDEDEGRATLMAWADRFSFFPDAWTADLRQIAASHRAFLGLLSTQDYQQRLEALPFPLRGQKFRWMKEN